ncbi:nuclear transport factor 2 family protein [Rhodococcus qingshengii]|uniref:nuclear transport factor 2 family protein n=1 Tax=Rhodococcus qingshengii TaxID=334542 RepID=UPI00355C4EFC
MNKQSTDARSTDIESVIRSLEDRRYAAVTTGDVDAFVALAHPDLAYTHSNAVVDTLTSYRDKLLSGYYVYHHIDHPVDRVLVFGDSAVVFGEMHADITAGGVRKTLANRSLAVWVRAGDQWLLLAYQPTVLPESIR